MHRLNSAADALNSGTAQVDTGGGVVARVPLSPAVPQDTGWRSVPCTDNGIGNILLRRVGDQVHLRLNGITVAAGSYAAYVATFPVGFVPADEEYFHAADSGSLSLWQRLGIYGGTRTKLAWVQNAAGNSTRPSTPLRGSWRWYTPDAWPATLPGTAA